MSKKLFHFKEFSINQEKSAMKIGTDGVLLGAWTPLESQPKTILDIGAGTGLIALMLAQRCNASQIDAVEIEENAYEEATNNFENSPWSDRLYCYHAALEELVEEPDVQYDLIVSNPPFYTENFLSDEKNRNTARFSESLPFDELLESVNFLLSENGVFAAIIPFREQKKFIAIAKENELFLFRKTAIRGNQEAGIKRVLLAFQRTENVFLETNELIIENNRHQYTDQYIALTKDFYIKM